MSIDPILKSGEWQQWRSEQIPNAAVLAAAARAWCASPYWKEHTPLLEDWKLVVEDLAREGLSERSIEEMARDGGRGLPFPDIPLFEDEQVRDLCRIADGPEGAAALVERLEQNGSLLSIDAERAAAKCWEHLTPQGRGGLAFATWQWMISSRIVREISLPSAEQAGVLAGDSRRRTEAIRAMEQAVRRRLEAGSDVGDALEIADALSLWHLAGFVEWAFALYAQHGGPAAFHQRLEAAVQANRDLLPKDPVLLARLAERGFPGQQGEAARLSEQLFAMPLELQEWASLEQKTRVRGPGSPGAHPLYALAEYLAGNDFPASLEHQAWEKMQEVLKCCPALLDIDNAHPEDPLPALVLAATVLSRETIGHVALGLIPLAPGGRARPAWWRSVMAGLQPRARRNGLGNGGDRRKAAVRVVQLYASRLSQHEAEAMREGFAGEEI